MALMAITHL